MAVAPDMASSLKAAFTRPECYRSHHKARRVRVTSSDANAASARQRRARREVRTGTGAALPRLTLAAPATPSSGRPALAPLWASE